MIILFTLMWFSIGVLGMFLVIVTALDDCDVKSLIIGGLLSSLFNIIPAFLFIKKSLKNML